MRRAFAAAAAAAAAAALGLAGPAGADGARGTTGVATPAATPAAACRADPLGGRSLYLRGGFNSWSAVESQRFVWVCDRWQLVARLAGEHPFKIADEGWSADADFGAPRDGGGAATGLLALRGAELRRRFDGVHRFTITMTSKLPRLAIESCPDPAPLGPAQLFLRGTPNNWAALDEFAFQYSCDAYYLNVRLKGRHEFKVADTAWKRETTIGASADGQANFVHDFDGEHTVRLVWAGGRPQLSVGPLSFADPSARLVGDPVALSLAFDSRDAASKRPFGAVPAGTTVEFEVGSLPGVDALTLVVERRRLEGNQELLEYTETARVAMTPRREGDRLRWRARHRFDEVAVHGWWFEARIGAQRYALQNNADAVHWTREKGSGGPAAVAELPASPKAVRRFRQTVFDPAFRVPDWAPDIVYYYIFPERFRNGDPGNDPVPGRDRYRHTTVEKHPQWLGRPYKPGSGDGSDAVYNNDFFGGDLAGIIDKLDDIRELGANTLYLTPIFKAGSNHKYDTADYLQVDPAFGSNADFERLAREAARRGMRIVLDTSLNHTGSDSVYFNRYGNFPGRGAFQNGRIDPGSPYASWYRFDPTQKDPDRQYQGWVGVTDLPELDKASPALREFFYRAPDSVMKRWLDLGAAGWRMDVAPWVPDDFWREWRAAIKAHRPDALTVAETWFDSSKYFLGDMFDSTMNYIFRNAVLDYAGGAKASDIVRQLEWLREAYPPQAFFALMNLLSTHDQARSLHLLGWQDGERDPAVIERAKRRLLLAVLFQMTYPGSPAVYYGDEVGVTGGDDPYNRAPYPWADQGGAPDLALRAQFRRLIALRHEHAVLRRGSLEAPLHVDEHVVVLLRRLGGRFALVATSNAAAPRQVTVALPAGLRGDLADALGGPPVAVDAAGRASFEVPALFGRVLLGGAAGEAATRGGR